MNTKSTLLYLLLFFPLALCAQFPTAVGTRWEYFQFFQDDFLPQYVMPSFEDNVVGDTLAGGNTYHVVRRTGTLYHSSGVSNMEYDTLDGTYYYRVQGTRVLVLDSVVLGTPHESLLYEFALALGDTVTTRPKNLINLTSPGDSLFSTYTSYYNYDLMCPNLGMCDSNYVVDTVMATPPWIAACHTFNSHRSIHYLPDVGTIYSQPLVFVLDVMGQYYYLQQLTVNGQRVWENPGIADAIELGVEMPSLQLAPNPAADRVHVRSSMPMAELEVLDGMGRVVARMQWDSAVTAMDLTLGHLTPGLYWVRCKGEDGVATKTLLIR
jgi:hypothetical protein